MKLFIYILFLLCSILSYGQSKVGDWEIYLDYSQANSIDIFEETVYVGTSTQLFIYNKDDKSISKFSKLNGLSDINISSVKFNQDLNMIIIGYSNVLFTICF